MNEQGSESYYRFSRNFFRFYDLLSYFDKASLPEENEEVKRVVAKIKGTVRRYDDTFIVYSYSCDSSDYIIFFGTPYDETHRAWSGDTGREWYDDLKQGTELILEVSVRAPSRHRVTGRFDEINSKYRYVWVQSENEAFLDSVKSFARKNLSSAYEFSKLVGSFSRLEKMTGEYGIEIKKEIDFSSEECLDLLSEVADSMHANEMFENLDAMGKLTHPLYREAANLSVCVRGVKDEIRSFRELLELNED